MKTVDSVSIILDSFPHFFSSDKQFTSANLKFKTISLGKWLSLNSSNFISPKLVHPELVIYAQFTLEGFVSTQTLQKTFGVGTRTRLPF